MTRALLALAALLAAGAVLWPEAPAPEVQAAPAPAPAFATTPLSLDGPCGHNVAVALERIGPEVVIPAGASWSFNGAIGPLDGLDYVVCAGVPGGAWCDLASRYAWTAAELGADVDFVRHGVCLNGIPCEYSVSIWSSGGPGGQDVTIRNDGPGALVLTVRDVGRSVVVEGRRG